ncbi:prepilin peptidase [Aeromicrobium wangtongii]|uniref:A24 family peptidase n=1 Tax=Aeromicrobium wangtongii TaxID=2969247 RepID=A0ABY5M2Z2_9ACTN|nr:A24 family peptidase [Aeromicrobium wangtongii]MCD9198179.1 A24 family peptidase [Aeromicrobium wangtongii]UUP12217.1 A24 family peptidase [Aeromicrobium wangtongii]
MSIVISALVAALIGAACPEILRRVPEPPDPAGDKLPYAVLAEFRFLRIGLAMAAAVLAAVVAWRIADPGLLPVWVVLTGVGVWLAFIDWHTQLLPYRIVAPLYVVSLVLVALSAWLLDDRDVLVNALIANAVVYALFRLFHWFGNRFFAGAFGYGDVRLSAVLALALGALGYSQVFVGIYAGFILGAVLGVVLSRLKLVDPRGYAFGPYMVVGAVIGAAWGPSFYG